MNLVASIIVPIFGMAVIGFVSGRAGLLGESAARGLSDFVFRLAIPVMLFHTLGTLDLPDIQWRGMAAYYAAAGLIYVGSALFARYGLKLNAEGAGAFAMGTAFANTVLLAMPIVLKVHGPQNMAPMFLIISFHTTFLFGVGSILVETWRARASSPLKTLAKILRGLVTNPIIIGLGSGMLLNVSGLQLPGWLNEICDMFAKAAVPCALFSMGLTLSGFRLAGNRRNVALIVAIKLLLHPLLMWVIGRFVFHLEPLWLSVSVISAAMPSGINSYLFAAGYRAQEATLAAAVLAGTALSMVSVTVLLMLGV